MTIDLIERINNAETDARNELDEFYKGDEARRKDAEVGLAVFFEKLIKEFERP